MPDGQLTECSFCQAESSHHLMLPEGVAPEKAKDVNTQKDDRNYVIVRFCPHHWNRLMAKIIELKIGRE